MSLTLADGPLAAEAPDTVNYTVVGPPHRLLLASFPRRVRAVLAGETVLDTRRGRLLHETGRLPQLFVPLEDIRDDVLVDNRPGDADPHKGPETRWTLRVADRVAEDAAWGFEQPPPEAGWLRGRVTVEWDAMDAWFDEDEEVVGHLRDPYHRVDARQSSRRVRVVAGDVVLAESDRPVLVSETGLPNRWYLPQDDVRTDLLEPSATRSVCPYKGVASYWTARVGGSRIEDAAWSYEDPLEDTLKARSHLCFDAAEGAETWVDDARVA